MGDPTSRRKAYKLKSPVTRDSFLTWDLNHQSFCRQDPEWKRFLPGQTRATWTPFDEDETRGIHIVKRERVDEVWRDCVDQEGNPVPDLEATDRVRSALQEFLVCLGTYAPENFMHTVTQESSSYSWVLDKIKATFNLNTKGLGFLAGGEMKIDFSEEGQTYQQGFQAIKEFYCSSLLKKGDKYKGKAFEKNEPLTPLGENMIVEKWLTMINPKLISHIRQTRGHLFTDERPNLFDNQKQLCEQIDTMLQEMDTKETPGINRAGFNFPQGRRPQSQNSFSGQSYIRPNLGGALPRMRPVQPAAGRPSSRGTCPSDTCIRCYEAGRFGPASKTHYASNCTYPPNRKNNQPMRVLLVPASQQNTPQIREVQLHQDLLQQGQPGHDGYEQEEEIQSFDYFGDDQHNPVYDFNNLSMNKYDYNYDDHFTGPQTQVTKSWFH